MKSLIIDTSQGLTRSGTLKLPTRGPATASATPDAATEPPLGSELSLWLQQNSQPGDNPGSIAALMNVLTTIQRLFPQAAPELLMPLLHKLQPFVLTARQVSDALLLRLQVARSGLFLEGVLAHEGTPLPIATEDIKLQLFQLLMLMDPARQLTLLNNRPTFVDGAVKSARGLQGSNAYSGKSGVRGGRVQAYLECSHDDRQVGVSDGQLNPWLQLQVEEVLQQLVSRQLHSHDGPEGTQWQVELQYQHGDDVVGVAMTIVHPHDSSQWKLAFLLELPQLGKVGIVMTIDGNRVELDYQCSAVLSVATRKRHWQALQQAFAARTLMLATLNHRLVHL